MVQKSQYMREAGIFTAFVFAEKGTVSPLIAAFIPNVVFAILGVYLIYKAPK